MKSVTKRVTTSCHLWNVIKFPWDNRVRYTMYEFDEESWDEQQADAGYLGRPIAGWLIEWKLPAADQRFILVPRFLQIGTGQWCAAEYATLFPERATAEAYADEFGIPLTGAVRIVQHRF